MPVSPFAAGGLSCRWAGDAVSPEGSGLSEREWREFMGMRGGKFEAAMDRVLVGRQSFVGVPTAAVAQGIG